MWVYFSILWCRSEPLICSYEKSRSSECFVSWMGWQKKNLFLVALLYCGLLHMWHASLQDKLKLETPKEKNLNEIT